jgi:hypothetical protein
MSLPDDGELEGPAAATPGKAPSLWPAMVRGVLGGIAGGVLGYFVFFWLLDYGLYGIVLPGASVGIGCGAASGRRITPMGVLSALGGLFTAALAEWRSDVQPAPSFLEFLPDLPTRTPAIWLILAGVAISFFMGIGRNSR